MSQEVQSLSSTPEEKNEENDNELGGSLLFSAPEEKTKRRQ